jgi:predicted Zn-ribbon and HTH transcriptional regulator
MPEVSSHDIRKIIFDNFNDTDTRFSNDEILGYLNQIDRYKALDDVLDFEDVLLEMEKSGMLRPIAQNFNTRYYRLWNTLEPAACKACNFSTYFTPNEEGKTCPQCGVKMV